MVRAFRYGSSECFAVPESSSAPWPGPPVIRTAIGSVPAGASESYSPEVDCSQTVLLGTAVLVPDEVVIAVRVDPLCPR